MTLQVMAMPPPSVVDHEESSAQPAGDGGGGEATVHEPHATGQALTCASLPSIEVIASQDGMLPSAICCAMTLQVMVMPPPSVDHEESSAHGGSSSPLAASPLAVSLAASPLAVSPLHESHVTGHDEICALVPSIDAICAQSCAIPAARAWDMKLQLTDVPSGPVIVHE